MTDEGQNSLRNEKNRLEEEATRRIDLSEMRKPVYKNQMPPHHSIARGTGRAEPESGVPHETSPASSVRRRPLPASSLSGASKSVANRPTRSPVESAERKPTRAESQEVAALISGAEAEEKRRQREEMRRRMASQSSASTRKVGTTKRSSEAKKQQKNANVDSSENSEVTTMVVAVVSVVVILLLLWFFASSFLRSMGNANGGVPVAESSEPSSEQASESSSEEKKQEETQSESSLAERDSETTVLPLTEGDGDYAVADTWVGKTFVLEDDANVRSGPGTQNSIVGTVDPGDTIFVEEATMVDDSAWVHGTIQMANGKTLEGWLYSWTLSSQKQ